MDHTGAFPISRDVAVSRASLCPGDLNVNKFFVFCATFLALLATGALGQDVGFDSDTDFSKFKTYKWVTLKSAAPIALTDEQIKAALDAALALKGLSKIDGDSSADLFIGYQTTEQVEEQLPGIDPNTGFRTTLGGSTNSTRTIYKGQLMVNMYDAANRKLIWTGVASKTLDPKANAKKRQKNLNKAVQNLMKNYPPIAVGGPH
ncbi:MAG TPA: DUF4136 domain-containing protein [Terriglobales bacterium]